MGINPKKASMKKRHIYMGAGCFQGTWVVSLILAIAEADPFLPRECQGYPD